MHIVLGKKAMPTNPVGCSTNTVTATVQHKSQHQLFCYQNIQHIYTNNPTTRELVHPVLWKPYVNQNEFRKLPTQNPKSLLI